jgi:hypothetical protein
MCSILAATLTTLSCLLSTVIVHAAPSDRIEIRSSYRYARYASIEARAARIDWAPRLSFMPRDASDFAAAYSKGAWAARLDGPGDEQEQILIVRSSDVSLFPRAEKRPALLPAALCCG